MWRATSGELDFHESVTNIFKVFKNKTWPRRHILIFVWKTKVRKKQANSPLHLFPTLCHVKQKQKPNWQYPKLPNNCPLVKTSQFSKLFFSKTQEVTKFSSKKQIENSAIIAPPSWKQENFCSRGRQLASGTLVLDFFLCSTIQTKSVLKWFEQKGLFCLINCPGHYGNTKNNTSNLVRKPTFPISTTF